MTGEKRMVSVIIPSYNHADFVKEAIESVLSQDYENFELLVADDCSADNSAQVIDSFCDARMRKFFLKENLGAVPVLKFLIEEAKGEYIALLNSDDAWRPEKIRKQVEFLEANQEYGACFTWAATIDENGEEVSREQYGAADVFIQKNRSQGEFMFDFYRISNFLCHPSLLIRKKIYSEIGYYNPAFRQLPDMEFWVRLINRYPIHIITEPLVLFRIMTKAGENTSAPTQANAFRNYNELIYIYNYMFRNMEDAVFIEGFKKIFKNPDAESREELICERFFVLLTPCCLGKVSLWIAVNYFIDVTKNEKVVKCFKEKYHFNFDDFYEITKSFKIDILDQSAGQLIYEKDLLIAERDKMISERNDVIHHKEVHIQNIEKINDSLREEIAKLQALNKNPVKRVVKSMKSFYNKRKNKSG